MSTSSTSSRRWQQWLRLVQNPSTRLSAGLVGLPGHMRLPRNWKAKDQLPREDLLYLVTEGSLQALVRGTRIIVEKDSLLWIRPGTPFICTAANDHPLSILRCRLRIEPSGSNRFSPWPWRILTDGGSYMTWLEWLVEETERKDLWSPARLRSLVAGLFSGWARTETQARSSREGLTTAQRNSLTELLAGQPAARATPRELARAAGLSYDYFSRCFRRSYGCTPRRWLLEQRIRLASLRLKESNLRVGEVAREFGYEDLFLFSRQFKLITGQSPLAYRRERS